jgi:hypothetical protein
VAGIFAGDMPAPQASPDPGTSFAPAASGPSAGESIGSTAGLAIGTAFGGPVGGALGSAIGGAAGGALTGGAAAPTSNKSSFDSSGFIVNFGRDVSGSGSGGSGTGASSGFLSSISGQLPLIIMAAAALLGVVLWKKL